jgi:hypothetical protein
MFSGNRIEGTRMKGELSIKQQKHNCYRAILSIILGIACITLVAIHQIIAAGWMVELMGWNVLLTAICAFAGIIIGILCFKQNKKLAIIGILASSIGLLYWFYYFLIWYSLTQF